MDLYANPAQHAHEHNGKQYMSSTIFDTWSDEQWDDVMSQKLAELPESKKQVLELIFCEGNSYEDAAEKMQRHPIDLVVLGVVGIRLIQEQMQRDHATMDPPWPKRGTGVPGAPIPKSKAVIKALKRLRPMSATG